MRSLFTTTALLLIAAFSLQAQGWKVGLYGGTTLYLGDLQEDIWHQESLHPALGISAGYYYKDIIGLRAQATIAHITGSDAISNEAWRRDRNLSFRSDIYEVALMAEVDLTGFWPDLWFHPYAYGGVAVFHFNPQGQYNGQWHDLQPLSTEGQGTSAYPYRQPYSLNEIAIPAGVGMRIDVGNNWQLGMEVTYRKTFTDHLDDVSLSYPDINVLRAERGDIAAALSNRTPEVNADAPARQAGSQRGNALRNDAYITSMVVLTKRLGDNVKRNKFNKKFGCPTKF